MPLLCVLYFHSLRLLGRVLEERLFAIGFCRPHPESRPLVCLAFKQIVREQASKRTRYSVDMTMNGYGKMVKIRIASPMDCIIFCQHRFEPNWCVSFLN